MAGFERLMAHEAEFITMFLDEARLAVGFAIRMP